MVGVGLGFILHELGHKFSAMHFGYWSEYQLWPVGLIIALASSFCGIVFAAPGAVYTYANFLDDRTNGIISIAGPVVNIVLAIIFLLMLQFIQWHFSVKQCKSYSLSVHLDLLLTAI